MKKIFFVFGLLFSFFTEVRADFIDENSIPQWAEVSIENVSEAKIMTGFGDGAFKPLQNLNRAEAVILIARMKNIDLDEFSSESSFQDVPSDAWFAKAVSMGAQKGWLKGKNDGNFYPGDFLNRAEFATMISRSFDLLEESDLENPAFKDVPSNVWFSKPVFAFAKNGLIRNEKVENYHPEIFVSRAEAAWVLAEILRKPRLMGTSKSNDLTSNRKIDSRRVAIKPRDFNPNLQSVDIEKKEIKVTAVPKDSIVIVKKDADWIDMGTIRLSNLLDDRAELNTLRFKLRFEATNVGPASNFFGRVSGSGIMKEASVSRNGELIFTGLKISILSGEEKVFRLKIKPDSELQFYTKIGEGKLSVEEVKATSIGTFAKEYSNRTTAIRYAPVRLESRDLSTIEFQP